MDEIKIESEFTRNLIAKVIKKLLKDADYDMDIQLNMLNVTISDGTTHAHLEVDADIEEDQLWKILELMHIKLD